MLIRQGGIFLRSAPWRVLIISALLVLPCFWHKRIEAGDLPSHTYNAWLSQLITQGKAPGLYVVSRWNNVLADIALAKVGALTGFLVAEHIIVPLAVLNFFWGAFAFISTAIRRPAWNLIPAIAMIAYGWTFYAGFLNYYLSLGFAFWAVALFWRGRGTDFLAAAVLSVLALLAHPMGFALLVGLAVYLRLSDILHGWSRWILFIFAFLIVLSCHFYILHLRTFVWYTWKAFFWMNGADQLNLFGTRYKYLAGSVFILGMLWFITGLSSEWKTPEFLRRTRAPLELWLLLVFTALMIPEVVYVLHSPMPFALAISRLTTVTGVLGLCILGSIKPKTWQLIGLAICALVFFVWTYHDTGILNNLEQQGENLVSALPYGRRITSTIIAPPNWRLPIVNHSVDRACIAKCFAYGNYEPSTGQFRIRARPGNPVVTDSIEDDLEMQSGFYPVQQENLPMNQVYQCDDKNLEKLCIRELSAGEQNGRIGYRPPRRF